MQDDGNLRKNIEFNEETEFWNDLNEPTSTNQQVPVWRMKLEFKCLLS